MEFSNDVGEAIGQTTIEINTAAGCSSEGKCAQGLEFNPQHHIRQTNMKL
jgi:hypothetical protein